MPRYKILASNRYADYYIVTAKDEDEALDAVYNMEGSEDKYPGVEIDHINSDCVGSDIFECELIEEKEMPHEHGDWVVSENCGAWVCNASGTCGAHFTYNGRDKEPGTMLARCFCGWAQDGGDGNEQLAAMGENVEDDY